MGVSVYPHRCVRYTYGMAKPAGRPSAYTPELGAAICSALADGKSLREICASDNMPPEATARRWSWNAAQSSSEFVAHYARSRDLGLDVIAEQMLDIADTIAEDANSRRVRVDARKWYLSKLAPKRYGDRLELAGDKEAPLSITFRRLDK
jgi:hypothetical protein